MCLLVMLLSLTLISCGDSEDKKTVDENKTTEEKIDTAVVEDTKDNTVSEEQDDTKVEASTKQTYIDKLDKIQVELKDLDKLYAGNTIEIKGATGEEYNI